MIVLNGTDHEVDDSATVADLIGQTHPDAATHRGVAVAVDRRVVPRSAWADSALVAGARVEFVTAVQGG